MARIQFQARATNSDLSLDVCFDGHNIFSSELGLDTVCVIHDFADHAAKHSLELTMHGKLGHHTVLDSLGNIVQDRVICIDNFRIDDLRLDQAFWQHSRYCHDFNGHGTIADHLFYGTMGCNGTVKFDFSLPLYLWLLENS